MRTKVLKNDRAETPGQLAFYDGVTKKWTYFSKPSELFTDYEVRRDIKTPFFRERIAAGELILNPMEHSSSTYNRGGGSASGSHPNGSLWYMTTGSVTQMLIEGKYGTTGSPPAPSLVVTDASNKVFLAAAAGIDKAPRALAEDAITIRETLRFARHPLQGILDVGQGTIKRFSSRSFKNAKGIEKQAKGLLALLQGSSQAWLYYRMAAAPFYRSLTELLDFFIQPRASLQPFVRLRSTASNSQADSDTRVTTNGGYVFTVRRSLTQNTRCTIYYKVTTLRSGVLFNLGLRPKDLVVGAWNAVPLSFMVDRVVNISAIARATMNLTEPTIIIEGGVRSTDLEETLETQASYSYSSPGSWTESGSGEVITSRSRLYSRMPFIPSVDLIRPEIDFGGLVSNAEKTADLASLVLQRLR